MSPEEFARTPDEVRNEFRRLQRCQQAYEALDRLLPEGSPLGYQVSGALATIRWLCGKGPALSDCLEDMLRYAVQDLRHMAARGQAQIDAESLFEDG